MRQAVVTQECLLGDAVLAHRHGRRRGANRYELGEIIERIGGDVLKFGGNGRAVLCQLVECGVVVVGRRQVALGNLAGRAVRIGVEHPDLVAEFVRGRDEEAAKLAATEHAQGSRRQQHDQTSGSFIPITFSVWVWRKLASF